ncbi:MAG: FAD:protein FMN transferase, partial [Gammaproteobacteria bacterium]|nr:FAD:protein FMN transferase [Gammaproteobacteria bacterium]
AEVAAVLPLVGHHNLESRREPPALRKQVPGLQVDLSSIAKGWAVDEISALLRRHGVTRSLVEIGGEVYASRDKAPGRPWRVAIERPSYASRAVQHVVALEDRAMATSGDYRNFFPAGGRRYSHTIDPRTGQAMQHGLASVTVIAQNCTDADAWATALMALGEGRARLTAEREGLMALLIVRTDDGFREFVSPRLADS